MREDDSPQEAVTFEAVPHVERLVPAAEWAEMRKAAPRDCRAL